MELEKKVWLAGEEAAWLADKIVACGEYGNDAARLLRMMSDMQKENAKLREELEAERAISAHRATEQLLLAQRIELAEAKIREAEAQEPVAYSDKFGNIFFNKHRHHNTPLYLHPIPPADVAELQAKYDRLDQIASDAVELNNTQAQRIAELEREIRELKRDVSTIAKQRDDLDAENLRLVECNAQMERKLAEQQASIRAALEWIPTGETQAAKILRVIRTEELNALLAKARAEAVPNGWMKLPIDVAKRASDSLGSFCGDLGWGIEDMNNMDALDAYIAAAAPKPGEEK